MAEGTVTPQRKLIDQLREEFGLCPATGKVTNSRAFDNLESRQDLNSELAHFLLELVQNADDLKYESGVAPSLTFRLRGNNLLVISNEQGFTARDVESICSVGDSSKVGQADTTGEKGIGFKSLFKACEKVTISSNGYHFQFSLHRLCGGVVPEWKELPLEYQRLEYKDKTVLMLTFENQAKLDKVKDELLAFDAKLLLFLRRLRTVEVDVNGARLQVERIDCSADGYQTTILKTRRKNYQATSQQYAIVPYTSTVTVRDEARKSHKTTKVTLAFPLGESEKHYQAYNCLPICTTGFPFLLQGDFILSASREGLDESHSSWNSMLFHNLAECFLRAVKRFNTDADLKYSWLKYLPMDPPYSQLQRLATLIQGKLKQSAVLLTQSDNLCIPSNAHLVPNIWRDKSDKPLVDCADLKPPNLSTSYGKDHTKQLRWLGCITANRATLLSRFRFYAAKDDGRLFQSQSIVRLTSFATALQEYHLHELDRPRIIPVEGGRWVSARDGDLFFPQTATNGISVFEMPRGLPKVQIVKSEYVSASQPLKDLFTKLGVKEGSVAEACRMIEEVHAKAQAPSLDRAILIEQALYLFKAWEAHIFVDYSSLFKQLWLCTESGAVVLSQYTYQPAVLVEQSILEYVGTNQSSRQLMHADYLRDLPATSREAFSKWLLERYKVLTWLRICKFSEEGLPTSEQTPEFEELVARKNCGSFLSLLTGSWDQNFGSSSCPSSIAAYGKLKDKWASNKNKQVLLKDTFLPRDSIKSLAPVEVPFLNVADPEDPKWQMLRYLKVTTAASASEPHFWMACLRSLMDTEPTRETVLKIYEKLSAIWGRYSHVIKSFFKQNSAIFIPSQRTWIKPSDCLWKFKYATLRHKCVLSVEYPDSLEVFFRHCVEVKNADFDDVVAELKLWNVEDDQDLVYLKTLLHALYATFRIVSERGGAQGYRMKLRELLYVKFVPLVKGVGPATARQAVCFNSAPGVPQCMASGFLIRGIPEIASFLKALEEAFGEARPGLSGVVQESSQHAGKVADCPILTQMLRTRSAYFGSAVKAGNCEPTDLDSRIARLAKVKVIETSRISSTLTIASSEVAGGIITGSSRVDSEIKLEEVEDRLDIYILSKAAKQGRLPPNTGEALGSYLEATTDKQLLLLDRILMAYSVRDVRDLLVQRDIAVETGEDKEGDLDEPTNDAFIVSQAEDENQSDSSNTDALASAPRESSESGFAGLDTGRASRTNGHDLQAKAGRRRARPRGTQSTATQIRNPSGHATSRADHATYFNSGPRRTDGMTRAVQQASASAQQQDPTAGLKGELQVYKLLKSILGDQFTEADWTSELRHLAAPQFEEWRPSDDTTFYADFTFVDSCDTLTEWLRCQEVGGSDFADAGWPFRYNIEVKSTSRHVEDPFHMSDWQWEAMKRMAKQPLATLADGQQVVDKFLVFRVLVGNSEDLKIVSEPWKAYVDGEYELRSASGMWLAWNT